MRHSNIKVIKFVLLVGNWIEKSWRLHQACLHHARVHYDKVKDCQSIHFFVNDYVPCYTAEVSSCDPTTDTALWPINPGEFSTCSLRKTYADLFKKNKKKTQPVLCSFSLHAVYYRPNEDISPRLRDFKKQSIYDSFLLTATAICIAQKLKITLITMLPGLFQAIESFFVAHTYREFSI